MNLDEIRLLDELAANASPATTTQLVDGWLLRATPDAPFHRANSVLPLADEGTRVDDRIALAEHFYRSRGLPVQFLVSPMARPPELDAVLESRGYAPDTPTLVRVAPATTVLDLTRAPGPGPVFVDEVVSAGWIETYASAFEAEGVPRARLEAYARLLPRLGPVAGAARLLDDDGQPISIGLGVVERGWIGLYAMGTRDPFRRRGAATALLHALVRWGTDQGARRVYLQVEPTNHSALSMYDRAGFHEGYVYHYRVLR